MARMTSRILSLALAFAVLAAPLHSALAQANNPYLDAALRLYADLEYEKALEQFAKAGSFPGNSIAQDVQINLYSGLIKLELGDRPGAESDFKTALALDPEVNLPGKVSPKVAELFEKARADILKARPPKPVVATPAPPPTAPAVTTPAAPQPTAAVKPADLPAKPADAPTTVAVVTTPAPATQDRMLSASNPVEPPPSVIKQEKSGGTPILPFVLMGIGAALGGGGAYFGVASSGSVEAARSAQFQSDRVTRLEDARSQAFTANVMYGAAGAAVVAGLIALIAGAGDSAEPAPQPAASP